jgi:hypothetical protein
VPVSFSTSCECSIGSSDSDYGLDQRAYIINSAARLEEVLFCGNTNEMTDCDFLVNQNIDFAKYSLLIGKKRLTAIQGQLISQSVSKACHENEITYTVRIKEGGYTAMSYFNFGVLVPKLVDNANVSFDVKVVD